MVSETQLWPIFSTFANKINSNVLVFVAEKLYCSFLTVLNHKQVDRPGFESTFLESEGLLISQFQFEHTRELDAHVHAEIGCIHFDLKPEDVVTLHEVRNG